MNLQISDPNKKTYNKCDVDILSTPYPYTFTNGLSHLNLQNDNP